MLPNGSLRVYAVRTFSFLFCESITRVSPASCTIYAAKRPGYSFSGLFFSQKSRMLSVGMFCLENLLGSAVWSAVEQFILNLPPALVGFWRNVRRDQCQCPSADSDLPSSNCREISPFVEKRKGGFQSHVRS